MIKVNRYYTDYRGDFNLAKELRPNSEYWCKAEDVTHLEREVELLEDLELKLVNTGKGDANLNKLVFEVADDLKVLYATTPENNINTRSKWIRSLKNNPVKAGDEFIMFEADGTPVIVINPLHAIFTATADEVERTDGVKSIEVKDKTICNHTYIETSGVFYHTDCGKTYRCEDESEIGDYCKFCSKPIC